MFKGFRLLKMNCLIFGVICLLNFGCKSLDRNEESGNLPRNSRYNFNTLESSATNDVNVIDSFLNNSCATFWNNMRELLTLDSTFKVTNQGSKLLGSSLENSESTYKITVNTESEVSATSQSFIKSKTFEYYWAIEPPQNLNIAAFHQECKVLQQIISDSMFYATTTTGTVKIEDRDYKTITLTITPSRSHYRALSDLGILKNYIAVLNPPSSCYYSITFTVDHMLILERNLDFTTNAIVGTDKDKTYKSKISDFVIKK